MFEKKTFGQLFKKLKNNKPLIQYHVIFQKKNIVLVFQIETKYYKLNLITPLKKIYN